MRSLRVAGETTVRDISFGCAGWVTRIELFNYKKITVVTKIALKICSPTTMRGIGIKEIEIILRV